MLITTRLVVAAFSHLRLVALLSQDLLLLTLPLSAPQSNEMPGEEGGERPTVQGTLLSDARPASDRASVVPKGRQARAACGRAQEGL